MRINYQTLRTICLAKEKDFNDLGVVESTKDGNLIYIDRGSDILGIAHLDSTTVAKGQDHFYKVNIDNTPWVFNAQLDDRLGVYILLDLLPTLNIHTDVLLTTGEEKSQSTGAHFKPGKGYLWMYQFDRKEDGVVHYQYDSKPLKKALGKAGFKKIERGMASDISKMGHVGCCGVNFGCGYEDYHSVWAKANMALMAKQVYMFSRFYDANKNTHFPFPFPIGKTNGNRIPNAEGRVWYRGKYVFPKDIAVCRQCGEEVEEAARYNNVCLACELAYDTCIFCQYGFHKNLLIDEVCGECRVKVKNKDNFMTGVTCMGHCGKKITYNELIEGGGYCYFCDKDKGNMYFG